MNILISAYACNPFKGSEPGVGWNLSVAIAQKHNVFVVTRKKNQESIQKYLKDKPIKNITFLYYDLPWLFLKVKKILGAQLYYILWNLMLIGKLKKWSKSHSIDVVHHITFNQYRTPSFGYFINKPFVVGPIGGAELIDSAFDGELEKDTLKREKYRRKGLDFFLLKWYLKIKSSKKLLVFSAHENLLRLQNIVCGDNVSTYVLPSIAINQKDFEIDANQKKEDSFTMIYAGRALDWKGLHLFLEALGDVKIKMPYLKVVLIGVSSVKEREKVERWIADYGLEKCVKLISFMPRHELLVKLTSADLFVYPAFRDSGSMAVLEACALGCPSICFNVGGQDAFPDDVLIKVPVVHNDYETTVKNFAAKLVWAYENKSQLSKIGASAKKFVFSEMVWTTKAEKINRLYNEIVGVKNE